MALALTIILFLTVALGVFSFGAAAYAPSSVLGARLRALGWQKSQPREKPAFRERLEHALDPFSKALPLSPSEVSRTRKWLIQAGYREPRHLTMYVGSRMLLALVGMLGVVAVEQGFDLLLMIGVGGFGFFVPRFVLKRMIKDRQRRITIALPDALDLTVICVEVGLALDQALMRVGEDLKYSHPDLSDRTGVDDVRALVTTLIQTDRFGTSIATALRMHSETLRTERRQRAEEQAAKTTIKMVVPLAVFILPSIIFVTLGPAMIQLFRQLSQGR